jgi:hypothetical protein
MRARTNWILLAGCVALSLYAYFFERDASPWEGRGRMFPGLSPEDIVEVEITRPGLAADAKLGVDARPFRARREGSPPEWWITEPVRYEGYHPRWEALVLDLADLQRISEVPPAAAAQALADGANTRIRFWTRDGKENTLELGKVHPDAKLDLVYCRSQEKCYAIRGQFVRGLPATLNDVRTRSIFGVAPQDAARCTISVEGKRAKVVERLGASEAWRLRQPMDAQADRELVEAMLSELNAWTVETFVNDAATPDDWSKYGLARPRVTITMERRDRRSVRVVVGSELANPSGGAGLVYLRKEDQPFVLTASAKPLAQLFASPEELRSRYVFELGLEDVTEIRASYEGAALLLRRAPRAAPKPPDAANGAAQGAAGVRPEDKAPESYDAAWDVVDPAGKVLFAADKTLTEALVLDLRKLLILKFFSEPLQKTLGKLEVQLAGGRRVELELGPPDELEVQAPQETPKAPREPPVVVPAYRVQLAGEPGAYLVSSPLPEAIQEGPAAFRQRDISTLDPARALEITVVDGAQSWRLGRLPGEPWSVSTDTALSPDKQLKSALVNTFLSALHAGNFRIKKYLPEPADLVAEGLELTSPRRGLVLERVDGDAPSFRTLVFGRRQDNPPGVFARADVPGAPTFLVDLEIGKHFESLVAHLHDLTGR